MIRLLARVAALILAAEAAMAETVAIRSGDHPGFTRLVLQFDTRPAWAAGRVAAGYAIGFAGTAPLDIDLSRVFDRIGRDRVQGLDVDADGRIVTFRLGCDCAAEIVELGAGALVVDIRDRSPGIRATHEAPFTGPPGRGPRMAAESVPVMEPPETLAEPPRVSRSRDAALSSRAAPPVPDRPVPDRPEPERSVTSAKTAPRRMAAPVGSRFPPSGQPPAGRLPADRWPVTLDSAAVAAVTEQLSRATAQGLLEPGRITGRPERKAVQLTVAGPSNLRVVTGIDRDARIPGVLTESTPAGARCIPDRDIDLQSWGDPTDPRALGRFRRAAMAENGALTEPGLVALARHYLVMGFGAEARMVASLLPPGRDRDLIVALGEIIDDGASDAPVLAGQIACSGSISLWAALAGPIPASDLPRSPDHMLTAFSALPRHLRVHLGPLLSERLRAAGLTGPARTALNAVTRGGGSSSQQDLTSARLGLTGTGADKARAELERLASGTDLAAAEALLELLTDARRRGITPKPAWVDDAPSLIRATQGTEVARRLSVAALRAHVPLGRFDALRQALVEDRPGLTGQTRRDLAVEALAAAVADADDVVFLRTVIGFGRHAEPRDLGRPAALAVAERLLGLGMPRRALAFLPAGVARPAERVLAARVLAGVGRHDEALALVEGADTPEQLSVRAEILAARGRLVAAAEAHLAAEEPDTAARRALQSGAWEWLAARAPESLSGSVRRMIAPATPGPDGPPDEAGSANRALVQEVEARREAIRTLLSAAQVAGDG